MVTYGAGVSCHEQGWGEMLPQKHRPHLQCTGQQHKELPS